MDTAQDLFQALQTWAHHHDADDAWISGSDFQDVERRIVDLAVLDPDAAVLPPGTDHLYRGQGVSDEEMETLARNGSAVIEQSHRLVASWSTRREIAESFAETAAREHGSAAVVLRMPVSRLEIVYVFGADIGKDEGEVLAHNDLLAVTADDVLLAWRRDPATGDVLPAPLDRLGRAPGFDRR